MRVCTQTCNPAEAIFARCCGPQLHRISRRKFALAPFLKRRPAGAVVAGGCCPGHQSSNNNNNSRRRWKWRGPAGALGTAAGVQASQVATGAGVGRHSRISSGPAVAANAPLFPFIYAPSCLGGCILRAAQLAADAPLFPLVNAPSCLGGCTLQAAPLWPPMLHAPLFPFINPPSRSVAAGASVEKLTLPTTSLRAPWTYPLIYFRAKHLVLAFMRAHISLFGSLCKLSHHGGCMYEGLPYVGHGAPDAAE
eukprot:544878-Pelagomonas_calceolata.AAC.1